MGYDQSIENRIEPNRVITRSDLIRENVSNALGYVLTADRISGNFVRNEKKVKFTTYSNAELLAWGKSKKLIPEGGSTKDLINIIKQVNKVYGRYLSDLIKHNNGMKRGKKVNPFLVGKVENVYIDNPREYLAAIKKKVSALTKY